MKYKLIYVLCLSFLLSSCDNVIIHTKKSITSLQDSIKSFKKTKLDYTKTIDIKINKISELHKNQPDKFNQLKTKSDIIKENINDLNLYIDELKKEFKYNYLDIKNYDALSDNSLYSKLLFEKGSFSSRALLLKEKIDLLYKMNKDILNSDSTPYIYNEKKFNTNSLKIDKNGKEIEYINLKLEDKSAIGVLYNLEKLELELKVFHFLYMNYIIQ